MEASTALLSILAALGLAAACGFRVFVPLFVVSLASRAGALDLSTGFAWIGSTPALVCFGTGTTAGLGNSLVASGEAVAAGMFSGFAIFLPVLLPLVALALVVVAWRRLR